MSEEVLKRYFEQFGPIEDVFRALAGRGDGILNWGCISFRDESSVQDVLAQESHIVLGSHVEIQPFFAKEKTNTRVSK